MYRRHARIAPLVGLIVLAGAGAASAQVYRCEVDGKTVFTDRACAAGSVPHELPPLGQMPAGEAADLAEDYDERRGRERENRDRANARWLQEHQRRKAEAERFEAAIRDGRTLKGMTPDHVRRALGRPDDIERSATSETWIYDDGRRRRALVFRDGQLSR